MTFTAADAQYMARALQLARRGLYTTDPNPRVGCVIVKDEQVVGEGFHATAGAAHAEVNALAQAGERARGATVYATLEPCCHHGRTPPCTDALIAAGVRKVVAAMRDPNPRVAGNGDDALKRRGIDVHLGLMQEAAADLNPGFIARMKNGRPWVRVKLAASLDGRTALASGASQWITGDAARADVQRWRARSSAIVTGIGTVLADDPRLTVRDFDIGRHPVRVVLDSRLRIAPTAKLLRQPGRTLIATAAKENDKKLAALRAAGAEILFLPGDAGNVDLNALVRELAVRETNELLIEAGAGLSGAFINARLVDELVLYYAPLLLGDAARGMFDLASIARLDQAVALEVLESRALGKDWRIIARVRH